MTRDAPRTSCSRPSSRCTAAGSTSRATRAAGGPYAYTRAALANESASWWRRRRVAETLGEVPAHADRATGDAYAAYDTRDEVARAVLALPPRMRAVVVLRYFDDLSEAATADALGMSLGSVKSQASRGLDRLRGVLRQNNGTPEKSLS